MGIPLRLSLIALLALPPAAALAQDWTDFVNREDGFRVNFPGEPKVAASTYTSEYGASLPARVYSAESLGFVDADGNTVRYRDRSASRRARCSVR